MDQRRTANEEHIAIFNQGPSDWTQWRKEMRRASVPWAPDLRNIDLQGRDLREYDLLNVRLYNANLVGANLSGMKLNGVHLSGADLTKANLRGADFYLSILGRSTYIIATLN